VEQQSVQIVAHIRPAIGEALARETKSDFARASAASRDLRAANRHRYGGGGKK